MYKRQKEHITSQQLLFPLEVELSKPDLAILQDIRDTLTKMGFVIDSFLEHKICFTGLPISVQETQVMDILEQLISDVQQVVFDRDLVAEKNEKLLLSLARSLAVKSGVVLHKREMLEMINTLFASENPAFTPDGKNVISTIPLAQIDSLFN